MKHFQMKRALPVAPTVRALMAQVLIALLPGIVFATWSYSFVVLLSLLIACVTAWLSEAAALSAQGKSLRALNDLSATVTATLLTLSLPPFVPYYVIIVGVLFAILLGKHAFGGLGQNPFNPAMVGYAAVFVSFPKEMTAWPMSDSFAAGTVLSAFMGNPLDGMTGATVLDALKHRGPSTLSEFFAQHQNLQVTSNGVTYLNVAWLAGGIWLWHRRIISWHAPVGMLAALALASLLTNLGDSNTALAPLGTQLFAGGTLLAAFFIVTDPASGATSRRGQLIFGALVGVLIFVLRSFAAQPDGIAFAVLLANALAPLIDRLTLARAAPQRP